MSGLFSRGYNGDCRDCVRYKDSFHQTGRNEWRCDYADEYFQNEYGDQCRDFQDIAEIKDAEERKEQQENALKGIILVHGIAESQKDSIGKYTKSSNNGCLIVCALIVIGALVDTAEKQLNTTFFWPLGTWLLSYVGMTVASIIANKKLNYITLIYVPLIFTILFIGLISLATGNNYFSIWIYQPDLNTFKQFHLW